MNLKRLFKVYFTTNYTFLILALITGFITGANSWYWTCENGYCMRNNEDGYASVELCQLICSSYLNLWPHPTKTISSYKGVVNVKSRDIELHVDGSETAKEYLKFVADYFKDNLAMENYDDCLENQFPLKITVKPQSDNLDLTIDTDESYNFLLDVIDSTIYLNINASTVFGVRHGIETILQLLVPNGKGCLTTLNFIQISDKPVYRHRGLLIDTARNYLPIDAIARTLNGMAASKLNVLHWHITDSQSFPLEAPSLPNMTKYGAYSSKEIYTRHDIRNITAMAKVRGIRVLLEIDGPSHAGNGWQWGPEAGLGNLSLCINQQPWRSYCIQPPCGQMNPANPNLYPILKTLFSDIKTTLINISMFHFGGDEVFIPCWNSSAEIIDYLNGKPLTEETFLDLWSEHQSKVLAAYDVAVGHNRTPAVVWTSSLTDPKIIEKYLSKERYIIHTWVPESEIDLITNLLNLGYQVIISTKDKWYLDHGFWGSTTFHKWTDVYDNLIYPYANEKVLGGEVCMWGELVDTNNIDSRIWPRASAAAERLWSNPRTPSTSANDRMYIQRERLVKRGIQADGVITRWCVQNPGGC